MAIAALSNHFIDPLLIDVISPFVRPVAEHRERWLMPKCCIPIFFYNGIHMIKKKCLGNQYVILIKCDRVVTLKKKNAFVRVCSGLTGGIDNRMDLLYRILYRIAGYLLCV